MSASAGHDPPDPRAVAEAREIVAALRTGAVPRSGLERIATGLDDLAAVIARELDEVAGGRGAGRVKWLRGEYGSGKTFAARYLAARARALGFATTEVQISINDTPLYKLETVYRRLVERLRTDADGEGALGAIVDAWLYEVGDEVMRLRGIGEDDPAFPEAVAERLERKLAGLGTDGAFGRVLRAYLETTEAGDFATARALLGWLGGQKHAGRAVLSRAGVRGTVDGPAALSFLRGVLQLLRESGYRGLVLVLDEVETVQRMRSDSREKALNALRQLVDMILAGELPGLYLLVTGTPAFYEGPHGLRALAPLAQRVVTDFGDDPRHDNLRAPQVRLLPFDRAKLIDVGRRVRDLYPADAPQRIAARIDDAFLVRLADDVTAAFGGRVDVAPRQFLRQLVDLLDRVDQHADFDPAGALGTAPDEEALAPEELAARHGADLTDAPPATAPDAVKPRRLE